MRARAKKKQANIKVFMFIVFFFWVILARGEKEVSCGKFLHTVESLKLRKQSICIDHLAEKRGKQLGKMSTMIKTAIDTSHNNNKKNQRTSATFLQYNIFEKMNKFKKANE